MLHLRTLGALDLRGADGRELRSVLVQPKRLALLVYLLLASPRGFHRRDVLLALFWPDIDATRARNALSKSLHVLRRGLADEVVESRGDDEVGIAPGVLGCDALAFQAAVAVGRVETAMELYQGDFFGPRYAPEGRRLAVAWQRGEHDPGVWLFSLDGAPPRRLSSKWIWPLGWSSDGETFYGKGPFDPQFYRISANGGEEALEMPPLPPHHVLGECVPAGPRRPDRLVCVESLTTSDIWMLEGTPRR